MRQRGLDGFPIDRAASWLFDCFTDADPGDTGQGKDLGLIDQFSRDSPFEDPPQAADQVIDGRPRDSAPRGLPHLPGPVSILANVLVASEPLLEVAQEPRPEVLERQFTMAIDQERQSPPVVVPLRWMHRSIPGFHGRPEFIGEIGEAGGRDHWLAGRSDAGWVVCRPVFANEIRVLFAALFRPVWPREVDTLSPEFDEPKIGCLEQSVLGLLLHFRIQTNRPIGYNRPPNLSFCGKSDTFGPYPKALLIRRSRVRVPPPSLKKADFCGGRPGPKRRSEPLADTKSDTRIQGIRRFPDCNTAQPA